MDTSLSLPMMLDSKRMHLKVNLPGSLVVVELGKCWYLDRMVLLFDALKSTYPDIAAWEH